MRADIQRGPNNVPNPEWAADNGPRTRVESALALAAGLTALALYLFTLAPSITLANGANDSGELAAAAYTLGIAHPTGYPLYTLVGYLVTHAGERLGGGEPAHSLNVFSALMGALAIGLLTLLALRAAGRVVPRAPRPVLYLAGLLAAAALALDTDFWTEAVVTETRTLALALDAMVLALLVAPARPRAASSLAAALVYGLALCDHLLSLYLAPAVLLLAADWAGRDARRWLALLGLFLLGLTPYLYLPLRAAARPLANWGDPATPARFLWIISGREYRPYMFNPDGTGPLAAIGGSLGALWGGLGGATLAAAAVGLIVLWRRARRLAAALALTFVVDVALTSAYSAPSAPTYLLPAALCACVAAATGWLAMGARAAQALARLLSGQRASAIVVCGVLALLVGVPEVPLAARARSAVADSWDTSDRDYGAYIVGGLPPHAVIFVRDEETWDVVWYAARALRPDRDVTVVSTALLTFAWYYRELRALPAFGRRALPDSDFSVDDGSDTLLVLSRVALLGRAVAPGHALYSVSLEPAFGRFCHQRPEGPIWRCVRRVTSRSASSSP
jgi:hypothetical protein